MVGDFPTTVLLGMQPVAYAMLAAGALMTIGALSMAIAAVIVWWRRTWSVPGRIGYSTLTVAVLLLSTIAVYYNLTAVPFGPS